MLFQLLFLSYQMKGDAESGGVFRATFEDKISMGDIVFCRVWVPVPVSEFTLVIMFFLCLHISTIYMLYILYAALCIHILK